MPERTRVQYGAIIDRTSKGLGYYLAEVSEDRARIESIVNRSDALFGFPGTLKHRVVTTSEWSEVPSTSPEAHDHEKCCRHLCCAHPKCCGYRGEPVNPPGATS